MLPAIKTFQNIPWAEFAWRKVVVISVALMGLSACSPKYLIVQGVANELAAQGQAPEDDLVLAREASAFYLKLSESVLREAPDNAELAEAVAAGFTQYAYAFVWFEAEKLDAKDSRAAQGLRERAARLYMRAQRHAMAVLERSQPGFRKALESNNPANRPALNDAHVGLAYWAAASWGGFIALSKDSPDAVADLPLAVRLAQMAYAKEPAHGKGALASLMGTFETARAGGSVAQALIYFDEAIVLGAQVSAGPLVAKAEGIALPAGNRAEFEALLRSALAVSTAHPDMQNAVMRERALWLLAQVDDLF
ncbi:MAG: TRAP transporter TatT component family protein [Rhodoferax sp.]|nr:TRAP transporter TatT component family protein [Rhodoferax sp.]MCF8208969.1 TRAP transporter TatT component family protein [Rhodoferax sp.]